MFQSRDVVAVKQLPLKHEDIIKNTDSALYIQVPGHCDCVWSQLVELWV